MKSWLDCDDGMDDLFGADDLSATEVLTIEPATFGFWAETVAEAAQVGGLMYMADTVVRGVRAIGRHFRGGL